LITCYILWRMTTAARDLSGIACPPCPHAHDAGEAALLLDCKPSWLKEQSRLRVIPFTLIGGSYRYTDRHLERILAMFEEHPAIAAAAATAARKPRRKPAAARPEPQAAPGVTLLEARPPRRRAS
jgi:hypothetical protein